MNKGVALGSLGRLEEAVGCYEEAIGILRGLVAAGRGEHMGDLATTMHNQAIALMMCGRWTDAADSADEAITIWERLVNGGSSHLTSSLEKSRQVRGLIDLRRRPEAG